MGSSYSGSVGLVSDNQFLLLIGRARCRLTKHDPGSRSGSRSGRGEKFRASTKGSQLRIRNRALLAIDHALGFWTWVSLSDLGLADDEATALMVDMVRGVVTASLAAQP